MERVLEVTEALVSACREVVELTRVAHVQGLVRSLVVVALDEAIELGDSSERPQCATSSIVSARGSCNTPSPSATDTPCLAMFA
jgi:hypothetical protein